MPVFRSAGISGYVGKKNMMTTYRHKKGFKKNNRFRKKVEHIIENNMIQKSVYSVLTPYQLQAAVNTVGAQATKVIAIKNSGADVSAIEVLINTHATAQAKIAQYYCDAYILKLALKNQEQTNVIFDLYECRPRISTALDAATALNNIATQTAGTGATTTALWGATPFQYPAWCEAFKILKKTRYLLAPGACEIIEIREPKKQRIDLARYYANAAPGPTTIMQDPKYSKFWMAIAMGEPTNDSVNVANVNTSSFKVDVVAREDYHYSWMIASLSPDNTLLNSLAAVANNEQEILVETGAKTVPPVAA
jgi:hypothetical protein